MAEPISRLTNPNFISNDLVRENPKGSNTPLDEASTRSFLELVIHNLPDQSSGRPISGAEHRAARRQVFESLVVNTLEQPGHPYSGLRGKLKEDMIAAITDELVSSHYKV